MKNIMRFFSAIALGAVFVLAACTKDNGRGPSPVFEGAFINSSFGNAKFDVYPDDTQFVIPFMRTNKSGALTVQLEWTSANMAILPNPPASVSFSDGQDRVDVIVNVNIDNLEPETPVAVSIVLKDNAYLYGLTAVTMTIVRPLIYGEIQVGYFTDGAMSATFGVDFETFVKFQKAVDLDIYRLVDAYQPETTYEGFPMGNPYIVEAELTGDRYIVIDATDPEAVILKKQSTGVDWDYGDPMTIEGVEPGTFENNVITIKVFFDPGDGDGESGIDIFDFNPQTAP